MAAGATISALAMMASMASILAGASDTIGGGAPISTVSKSANSMPGGGPSVEAITGGAFGLRLF